VATRPHAAGLIELRWRTPAGWGTRAAADPLALLSDHAQCELQAAQSALALLGRNPGQPRLVDALGALAHEELRHHRMVVELVRELGGEPRASQRNPYAEGLLERARSGPRDEQLLARLLVAALIERRSLERFELLAAEAPDERLRALYAELAPSESGHARLFADFACAIAGAERAHARAADLCAAEAQLAACLPFAARIHGGPWTGAGAALHEERGFGAAANRAL
jgi:tRNA-(ms[2]io[6]A)-hydroxylase